jgi:murein DD-endopeptidase MepM/ murein hydrolase activator NlpD
MAGSGSPARALALWLLVALLCGCGPQRVRRPSGPGLYHPVQRGENLFRIGKAYGVDHRELAEQNGIDDPSKIEVGQRIFIPGATRILPVEIIAPRATEERPPDSAELAEANRGQAFRWPMQAGLITSPFGPRGVSFHDGLDIAAEEGTPVYAARDGRVIYSDHIPGYGNIVIVSHERGLTTVYAHNSRNEVREGQWVRQGDKVSELGRSGRTTGPNLHFEVRTQNVARNPLYFLPPVPSGLSRAPVGSDSGS